MATRVSTASKGYKQIHFNDCIYIARMSLAYNQVECFFTLVPHGHAGVNSIKKIYVNPLQCWYLRCADVPNSIQSDHLLFLSSKKYNCLVGSARLSRVYARPSRGSRVDRYTPRSIVEHRGFSPNNSSQKYVLHIVI